MAKTDIICLPFFFTAAPVLMIILLTFGLALTASQVKSQLDNYNMQKIYYCQFNCTNKNETCQYTIFGKGVTGNITIDNDCTFCDYKNDFYYVTEETNKLSIENPIHYPSAFIVSLVFLSLSILAFCSLFVANVAFWTVLVLKFGTTQ